MNFNELYPLLDTWVWHTNYRYFNEPVRMRLTGLTVRKKDGLYFITVELTDTRGATYIAKAESISEQVPGAENGS